jgi:hypothetical protein
MLTGALVNTRGFAVADVNARGKIGLKIAVLGPLQKGSGGRSVKRSSFPTVRTFRAPLSVL